MPTVAAVSSTKNGTLVAALVAAITNWDEAETRQGRRGDFKTTGANMIRLKELDSSEREQLSLVCGAMGCDLDDEELEELFAGSFEFQVSFSCNRFPVSSASGPALTMAERRVLDKAAGILVRKEKAAAELLTMPRAA